MLIFEDESKLEFYRRKESFDKIDSMNKDELYSFFKVEENDHEKIKAVILKMLLQGKSKVKDPVIIIDIAPTGSGKTQLNQYGKKNFKDNNIIILNSDEFKHFHPNVEYLAKNHPKDYTKITDQETNYWTPSIFAYLLKNYYNIIFEGTGRNSRILQTIKEQMANYKVIVRGMAVDKLNCYISIVDRFLGQIEKNGYGRLVDPEHLGVTYTNMPEVIQEIEDANLPNLIVEVYRRGKVFEKDGVKMYEDPQKIYSSEENHYKTSKTAVLEGRELDRKDSELYYKKRMIELVDKVENTKMSDEEKRSAMSVLKSMEEEIKKREKSNMDDRII